jgi:hypothetical protein
MRILFLDDNLERWKAYRYQTIGCDVKHVETAKACMLAMMNDEKYDLVSLDHDLGGKTFQEEKENSGTEVAEFIKHMLPAYKYPTKIVIHSWNPQGAARIMNAIATTKIPCRYEPFKAKG